MVYGRAGEEILYFRERGHEPVIVPGLSSAITGPALANIPVTQRGVAESFIVCTGVGRNGKEVQMPGYQRERTTIVLMGVARLSQLVQCLTVPETPRRVGDRYPDRTPIAIIERSSMPDQRVVLSTLRDIEEAFASLGAQRPPGMIVVGWAVLALAENGFIDILDDSADYSDEKRLKIWLGNTTFKVMEGLSEALIAL
jgi:uroporphyrin-III C-methyltransferase